ncbi:MAG: hypothetical protein NUV97_01155 [archaeon]|nr:hypothetical protein [archaeon]MCR4323430.1 hypothetical protein [Nanoarchaeota archaeon]
MNGEQDLRRGTTPRELEIPLAPNEFIWVQDTKKGDVRVWVGPCLVNLTSDDKVVVLDGDDRFVEAPADKAKQRFATADEKSYLVLANPTPISNRKLPETGTKNSGERLEVGKTVNIPGPISIPLWPGQKVQVVPGHVLKTNEFLVLEITNPEQFEEGMKTAVIDRVVPTSEQSSTRHGQTGGGEQTGSGGQTGGGEQSIKDTEPTLDGDDGDDEGGNTSSEEPSAGEPEDELEQAAYTRGQRVVIKGTVYSYFIPPTGGRVIPEDGKEKYVRSAVTLETMEFCVLLGENGEKRFLRGPRVVFPKSTETFVTSDEGSRVFRAIELNDDMGIHVKVIEEYTENGRTYTKGEELFITGRDTKIYFPRPEHAVITYENESGEKQEKHFAVIIPKGEGRYVLDKVEGTITLIRGPKLFLADPRRQVHIVRGLTDRLVNLLFPGNMEAQVHNRQLREISKAMGSQSAMLRAASFTAGRRRGSEEFCEEAYAAPIGSHAEEKFAGDEISRRGAFTPPRSLKLDTRFQGAVGVSVYEGYAVQVTSKTGEQKVVVGPETVLLEYDEGVTIFKLLTGTPKTDDKVKEDVYLRIANNPVSDEVTVETRDFVQFKVRIAYTVDFLKEHKDLWFSVENYIQLLVATMRSLLRNIASTHSVEEMHDVGINIVRDAIIGKQGADGKRPGRTFPENGMHIKEVQIEAIRIVDGTVGEELRAAELEAVTGTLKLKAARRELELTTKLEEIERSKEDERAKTARAIAELKEEEIERRTSLALAEIGAKTAMAKKDQEDKLDQRTFEDDANFAMKKVAAEREAKLATTKLEADVALKAAMAEADVALKEKQLQADVALKEKQLQAEILHEKERLEAKLAEQESHSKIAAAELERKKAQTEENLRVGGIELERRLQEAKNDGDITNALVSVMSEKIAPALKDLGDKKVLAEIAQMCAPIAMFGKDQTAQTIQKVFGNVPGWEGLVEAIMAARPNTGRRD